MNETLEMFRDRQGVLTPFSTNQKNGDASLLILSHRMNNAAPKFNPLVAADFQGRTFDARHDKARLVGQLARVRDLMSDGRWRTLEEIGTATGDQTQAVSARLRDLRKIRFGMHTVDRRRRGDPSLGIWEYRVLGSGLF